MEQYAVMRARTFYESRKFEIVEKGKPYDLRCSNGQEVVYVEVKGTTTEGDVVLLTKNEVSHARESSGQTHLYIVRGMQLRQEGGNWVAFGGADEYIENWCPADQDLIALQFRYRVPSAPL